jgi:hypothetical protein
MGAFTGNVYSFTGDPDNPVSDEIIQLPEDGYKIKMIGTDEAGKQYTAATYVAVDNTPAEITFKDYKPGVIEVDDSMYTTEKDQRALWVHTNVYDNTIDWLNEHGQDYDQSNNYVSYYDNQPFPGILGVNKQGGMSFGLLPEEIAGGSYGLTLNTIDLATNLGDDIRYQFVKKGTEYSTATYKEDKVELGDTVTFTLNLSNVKKLKNGSFDLTYLKNLYKFKDIKVNPAFAKYAKENGIDVTLDDPSFDKGDNKKEEKVHVGASLDGSDTGFSGNSPFIDVTFKVIGDEEYGRKTKLSNQTVKKFNYQKMNDKQVSIPIFALDDYQLVSRHSILTGFIMADAFMHEGGFPLTVDYPGMGVKVYAKSPEGKVYKGSINKNAEYEIKGLPVTKDPYELFVEVPGHLTSKTEIQVSKSTDDGLVGKYVKVNAAGIKAGDINGDGVIDIHDVMRAVAMYKKNDKETDINKDGIVDEKDIRFIEKNFMAVGPDVKKKPLEKLGKKSLNDFLKALGLEPAKE